MSEHHKPHLVEGQGRATGKVSRLLGRMIFGALLALILLVAIPYGTVEAWSIMLFEIIAFTLGALWMGGTPLATRLETVSGELTPAEQDPAKTASSRRDIWRSTLTLIKAHPLAGSGFGGYWIAVSPYHEGSGTLSAQQAHNDYLELAASGDFLG